MKVTKHQAKDGSLHDTARACEAHDRKLKLAPAMEKFVNGLTNDAPGLSSIDGRPAIALESLEKFLAEHAELLQAYIANALIVRKPRKAKKSEAPAANDAQAAAA